MQIPGVLAYSLGSIAAVSALLLLIFEVMFAARRSMTISITLSIIVSQVIAFCIVLPTILFTNHPWGGGIGILGYLFLVPPSLIAAVIVWFTYRRRNRPLLGRHVTITAIVLVAGGIVVWFVINIPPHISALPSTDSYDYHRSDSDMRNAREALNRYGRSGLIQKYLTEGKVNVILVHGARWRAQSRMLQDYVFNEIVGSYYTLGYSMMIEIRDSRTGEAYAVNNPRLGRKFY